MNDYDILAEPKKTPPAFEPKTFVELCSAMQQNTVVDLNKMEGQVIGIEKVKNSEGQYLAYRIFNVKLKTEYGIQSTQFVDRQ